MLSKRQVVVDKQLETSRIVSYAVPDEDSVGDWLPEIISISRQTFDDMGRPTKLTLTIQPGDTLNEISETVPGTQIVRPSGGLEGPDELAEGQDV